MKQTAQEKRNYNNTRYATKRKEINEKRKILRNTVLEHRLELIHRNARGRAKRSGWEFDILKEDLERLYKIQNGLCALTRLPMSIKGERFGHLVSLDRKNSLKGYTYDNIQFVISDVNNMKRNMPQEYFFNLCSLLNHHHGGQK